MSVMRNVVSWLPVLASLLAVVVSGFAAWYARAAWRIGREKLRLDIYNRRFDIYSRALDFCHALGEWSPIDSEQHSISLRDSPDLQAALKAFIKASRESQFLFEDMSGIPRQLEQLHADGMWLIGYKHNVAPALNGPELVPLDGEFRERLRRVNSAILMLEQPMSKYLNFHEFTSWDKG